MYDRCRRRIRYLRVSVTDLCNLRCRYCMPEEGVTRLRHGDLLSFEEVAEVVRAAAGLGFDKVRLTGGEPLVRRGIVDLARLVAAVPGIGDLAMTTNGVRLPEFARPLREAGVGRLNISLDSVDPARYAEITRGGRLADALAGIEAALAAGFGRIKLNCVVEEGPGEPDARAVAAFAAQRGLELRCIRRMDTATGRFQQVIGGDSGHCAACNRLRLSSDGWLYPCLFNDLRFSVRELGPEAAIRAAVEGKPEAGGRSRNHLYTLGG